MLHDPVIDEARAQGVSIAEYLQSKHKARQQSLTAKADRARREAAIKARRLTQEAAEQRRVKQRLSWCRMVNLMIESQEKADAALDELVNAKRRPLNEIIMQISLKYGVSIPDLKSRRKLARTALARTEYYWRARMETEHSLNVIGRMCGGKDHTTILSGVRRYERLQRIKAGLEPVTKATRGYSDMWDLIIPMEGDA